ncbi:Hint domain-containing protein [Paracoccus sp. (in: a-proteobacteria)]|uniref:Hint domain-containing protein n=1 Tax=Paracoccus sp. TaxID=267 RepID=UPI0026DF138F|nr:Hint domain-containing protein [Paracoccus sp. (in: a-proteobacteria)]MDO5369102.1 Hint domain-containing protein [Paracoccus sp. (in: a-proteobacteria)]
MTFCSCPAPGGCDTTFKAIYLGDVHKDQYIDQWELIPGAESAGCLSGTTFGSGDDPLAGNIVDITVTRDWNGDGKLEGNNFLGLYDTFSTSPAVDVPQRGTDIVKQVDSFRFDGVSQYKAVITYTDGTCADALVTVIQDDLGRTFLVPPENGKGVEAINAKPIASIELGKAIPDKDGDYNYCPPDNLHPVPCFTAGVRLATAKGQRPVEKLSVGDLVETADNGLQPIRWIGNRTLDAVDLAAMPRLRPIRIRKGALGDRLPKRDLLVSPQHRMMVRSAIAQKLFGTGEVLVAARHLLALDGVEVAEDVTEITYVHLLFDRHEVVYAEGAQSESLYTGEQALRAVGEGARAEILALFPELAERTAPGARMFLNGRQGRDLAAGHAGVPLQ